MPEAVIYCRCKQRASGLFRTTAADGTTRNRIFCAACAFNQPKSVRVDLIKSFTTSIGPVAPKPEIKADSYVKTVIESKPMRPYVPNFATGDLDPNPAWIRSLRNSK